MARNHDVPPYEITNSWRDRIYTLLTREMEKYTLQLRSALKAAEETRRFRKPAWRA